MPHYAPLWGIVKITEKSSVISNINTTVVSQNFIFGLARKCPKIYL